MGSGEFFILGKGNKWVFVIMIMVSSMVSPPLTPWIFRPPHPSPPFKGPLLDKKHVPHLLHCSMIYWYHL